MLTCPICNDWLISSKLCEKCYKIRNLYALYGDKIFTVLETCLIIQKKKEDPIKKDYALRSKDLKEITK